MSKDKSYQEYRDIQERMNNPDQERVDFIHAFHGPIIEEIWHREMGNIVDKLNVIIPQDPVLCRLIIIALLERLGQVNENERGAAQGAILTMANIERTLISPERKVHEYGIELDKISEGKVSRLNHYPPTIQTQSKVLRGYFKEKAFPKACNKDKRGNWIIEHKQTIYNLLIAFTCPCEYQGFNGWSKDIDRKLMDIFEYPDNMRACLLAALHNTTIENIKKILKNKNY